MKKFLSIIFSLVCAISVVCFAGCGGNITDTGDTDYDVVSDSDAHYLVFCIENTEICKMLVVSTDTYESLEPYFPLIPEKSGYSNAWEKVNEVYSNSTAEIYINAYYYKLQP